MAYREEYVDLVLVYRLGVVHRLNMLLNTVAFSGQDGLQHIRTGRWAGAAVKGRDVE
jgi:hypothetical protein